jgi:hypothetical protein
VGWFGRLTAYLAGFLYQRLHMPELLQKRFRTHVTGQCCIVEKAATWGVEDHARWSEQTKSLKKLTRIAIASGNVNPD